jgi:hypothetical protein
MAEIGLPQLTGRLNTMNVLARKNALNQQQAAEAAAQRTVRMSLILSLTILGAAVAYFGALYLIAH